MLNVDRDRRLAAIDLVTSHDARAAANIHVIGQQ